MLRVVLALISLSFIISCSGRKNISPVPTVSETAKYQIAKPVNCANAKVDIATLEDEKASVGKRMLSGVRSVMPISAVAGLLMGDYSDRVEVTSGQYNEDIEAKIAQIKSTCKVH